MESGECFNPLPIRNFGLLAVKSKFCVYYAGEAKLETKWTLESHGSILGFRVGMWGRGRESPSCQYFFCSLIP